MGELDRPAAGVGVDAAKRAELCHGNGHQHVEGYDSCGTPREEPEDEGQRCEHFAHYGAVGQKTGEPSRRASPERN